MNLEIRSYNVPCRINRMIITTINNKFLYFPINFFLRNKTKQQNHQNNSLTSKWQHKLVKIYYAVNKTTNSIKFSLCFITNKLVRCLNFIRFFSTKNKFLLHRPPCFIVIMIHFHLAFLYCLYQNRTRARAKELKTLIHFF